MKATINFFNIKDDNLSLLFIYFKTLKTVTVGGIFLLIRLFIRLTASYLRRTQLFYTNNALILSVSSVLVTKQQSNWELPTWHSHYWIIGGGFLVFLVLYAFMFFSIGYNTAYDALVLFFESGDRAKSHLDLISLVEGGIAEAYDLGLKAGYEVNVGDPIDPTASSYETIYVSNMLGSMIIISLVLYVIYRIICYLLPVLLIILVIASSYYFLFEISISINILCSVLISLVVLFPLITKIMSASKQKQKNVLYIVQPPNI